MAIQPTMMQCTHIRLNGYRCGSPALRGQRLCYFHARMRRATKAKVDAAIPQLLLLEDEESIQGALMQIIDLLLYDQIELKRASLILRAIEIAARNVQNLSLNAWANNDETDYSDFDGEMVQEVPEEAAEGAAEEGEDGESRLPEAVLPIPDEHEACRQRRPCTAGVECKWGQTENQYVKQIEGLQRVIRQRGLLEVGARKGDEQADGGVLAGGET